MFGFCQIVVKCHLLFSPKPMYGNQMGMMGMQQQGPMGNMGMPQGAMMRPQVNMGMYGAQQPQMQQMQFQQVCNLTIIDLASYSL